MNESKSVYACYEEIKQREITELKNKLKAFGGTAHFGPDYTGEGATGTDFPYICVNFDNIGPLDVRVHAASVDENDHLTILACVRSSDYPNVIRLSDIAYGHVSFITDMIPVRTFSKDSFCISRVSREDLDMLGFDTSDIDDKTMERLASKLGDDYCEQLFWTSLEIIAEEGFGIPRKNATEEA